MSSQPRAIVSTDRAELVSSVAGYFTSKVRELISTRSRPVHVVLTGGSVAGEVLAAVRRRADRIDWSRVHLWWGDERWVAAGSAERNDQQARDALIGAVDIPHENVHAFAASDSGVTMEQAADDYVRELARYGSEDRTYPDFDITFLGVGPDGHIASLFPGREHVTITDRSVVAVRDSPKPPPERLTLTRAVLNSSERIWLVLSGEDKAAALGLALAGASYTEVPAAGARARRRTVFFVDADAAKQVPRDLIDPDY